MLKILLRCIMRCLFRIQVVGAFPESKAGKSAFLVVANHESFLDGFLLGLFLPIRPVFVVHTAIANNPWFRPLLALSEYLAVDPTSPLAMKQVVRLLEQGRSVVIFPEGRITRTGSLMKVYEGPAFVAARTQATIIPVRLDGAARTYFSRMSGHYPRRFFPKITISIQAARQIIVSEEGKARERRRQAGEQLRKIMQEMLFASQPQQTLFSSLCDAIAVYGRKRLLLEDMKQEEYSYQAILKMTLALGRLGARLAPEDAAVGVLLPNVVSTVALFLGLGAFKRVPAMLNYTAGTDGIQSACHTAKIKTIITAKQFVQTAKLEAVLAGLEGVQIIYLEELRQDFSWLDKAWLMGFALWLPRLAVPKASAQSPVAILFTSGSEGKPKGVVHSHASLLANIAQIRAVIDFSIEDKFLNVLPIFHAFGLTAGALLPILTGTKLFLYPSPLHYRVIPEIAYDRNCTVLFGTSTFLAQYAKFAHPYDFYRLRYVVAGAEKLSESVRQTWFDKFGLRILEGYGATETAPVLAVNTPMAYKTGTVGQLLPGMQAQLEPITGIDGGGQLHVSGPNLMLGYLLHGQPGVLVPPSSSFGAGWYNTGDIVEIDAAGFIQIKGRVKRFAKIAGEMVSLETVERIAVQASAEAQHAASSQVDAARGETIVLFTTDAVLARDQLIQAARSLGAAELAVAKKIVKVTALPLLGTGKIDYVTLKKMAELA